MGGAYTPRLGAGLLENRLGPALGGGSNNPNRMLSNYTQDGASNYYNQPAPPGETDPGGLPPGEYDWGWNTTNLGDYMAIWPGLPQDPSSQLGGSWYNRPGVGWVPEGWQDPRDVEKRAQRDREAQWRQETRERNSRGRLSTIRTSGRGLTTAARVRRPSLLGG